MINKGRIGLLTAALRSGLYEKGIGGLHTFSPKDGKSTWCCLGVASDIASKFGCDVTRQVRDNQAYEVFDEEAGYLPQSVMDWYGFEVRNPMLKTTYRSTSASNVNDSGVFIPEAERKMLDPVYKPVTFAEIADFFEATFMEEDENASE